MTVDNQFMPQYICSFRDSNGYYQAILGDHINITAETPQEALGIFIAKKRENGFEIAPKVCAEDESTGVSYHFGSGEITEIDPNQTVSQQKVASTPQDPILIAIEKMAKTQTDILETLKGIKLVITLFALWIILQAWIIKFQF